MKYFCNLCNSKIDKFLDDITSKSEFRLYNKCVECNKYVCLSCIDLDITQCIKEINIRCNCDGSCGHKNYNEIKIKKNHTWKLINMS